MGQLVYDVAASLDGFIAGPGGQLDGFLMEGPHVDDYQARLGRYDTVVMGRRTYELGYQFGMAAGAKPYPHMRTVVFSRTLTLPPDSEVEIVAGEPLEAVDRLKAETGGQIYLSGGAAFAGYLLAAGRVDRLILKLNPVLLGDGLPLAASAPGRPLRLERAKQYANGVALLEYDL